MKIKKARFDWRNIILMVFGIGFGLFLMEVFLRVAFSTDQTFLYKDYQSNAFLAPNKYWKAWHYPNNQSRHSRDCFDATYLTNEYGMKDAPVDPDAYKIALIGDSYVEGYGKDNALTMAGQLQGMVGDSIDVLNFGSSGGLGTVHQLSLYENLATYFKPELVVLFFLNYNDLLDNLNALDEGLINKDLAFTYPRATDLNEITQYVQSFETPPANQFDRSGLLVFKLANRGLRAMGTTMSSAVNLRFDFRKGIAEVYATQTPDRLEQAYQITRASLQELNRQVQNNGSEFIVVQLADPFQLDQNWMSVSNKKYSMELDPEAPNIRLRSICEELRIPYYSMYEEAKSYIEENGLKYPYIYHECDRHYNEEGNQLAAALTFRYLSNRYLNIK